MFGLTQREQRWKAEQQAAELIVGLMNNAMRAAADARIAKAEAEVARLLAELEAARDVQPSPPFAKGSWQHAVDDALVMFGKTSQEFESPHKAVEWLLQQQSEMTAALAAGVEGQKR